MWENLTGSFFTLVFLSFIFFKSFSVTLKLLEVLPFFGLEFLFWFDFSFEIDLSRFFFLSMFRLIGGGGLGIFGDLVYQEAEGENYGTDVTDALLGLPVAFAKDVFGLIDETFRYMPGGKEPALGREFSNFVKKYTPGSSIWYLRAAWERIIVDTLQNLIDPKFHKRNNNVIKRYQNKENRDYWWYPGENMPSDAPEISQ